MMNDTELLDLLQSLLDQKRYTGRCELRWSRTDRGWRLHETQLPGGVADVRQAIREFAEQEELRP